MNITIIAFDIPFPKYKTGTTVILYNLINELSTKLKIELHYFGDINISGEKYFSNLGVKINRIIGVYPRKELLMKNSKNIYLKPYNIWWNKYKMDRKINLYDTDILIFVSFESIFLYESIIKSVTCRIIFFEIDSLSMYYKRSFLHAKKILNKTYYLIQYFLIRRIESYYYNKVDKVIFVSEIDKQFAIRQNKNIIPNIFQNITNGVEVLDDKLTKNELLKNTPRIGFSGTFNYEPNIAAARFILDNIFEKLLNRMPDAILYLIGPCDISIFEKAKNKFGANLVVTDFVEDIYSSLKQLDIYISPLFIGSGMKNKILQAMNVGIPFICTSISIEGISQLRNGKNCIICDSKDGKDWVNEICLLLEDSEKIKKFVFSNSKIINDYYRWENIAKEFFLKCSI